MKPITIYYLIGIGILFVAWYFLVLEDVLLPYPAKIILQDSEIYDEPIFLTFYWETDDQIQVGKMISLEIEVRGLPYNKDMTKPTIELFFDERYLNYWSGNDKDEILPIVPFMLEPDWENNVFRSQKVDFRFIVPVNIPLEYCDYNLEPTCHEIGNIIHPAPYDLEERINSNRIAISASLAIVGLSATVVWYRIRGQN